MIRAIGEPLLFFALPFLAYAVWHALRLANPFAGALWTRRALAPLALAGLVLAVGGLLLIAITAPRYEGGYVPAHVENGRVVPGRMR